MAQTIRRKATTGVRRQARAHDTKRQVRQAKQKTSSLMDWLMRKLPFTEEQLHKAFLSLILLSIAAVTLLIADMANLSRAGTDSGDDEDEEGEGSSSLRIPRFLGRSNNQ